MKRILFIFLGLLICSGFVSNSELHAVDNPTKGLTMSPLRTELTVTPGTSQDKTLTLTNSNDQPITVQLSTEEFSVINQQYDYAFNIETQLAKWITFTPDTLDLAVGETRTVSYRIGVPLSAEPGGRYLSLFATTDAGSSSDGVISRQRIASLLYITVDGDFTRSGQLVSLNSPWAISGPSNWSMALKNTGTTHYQSRYSVSLKSIFGDKVISELNDSALILPGTVRLIIKSLSTPGLPGIYKVVYNIGLGDSPARVETRYIIYMPPLATLFVVFVVIPTTILISQRYSMRNKKQSN